MSKVIALMSMSLDGFVADSSDGVNEVFDWYFNSGDAEVHTGGADPMTFRVSGPSARHIRGITSELGAVLTGRRTFDVAQGWGGNHAWGPAFVLTHQIPTGWPRPDSTVHFVTDGIESAVNRARAAAGDRSVGVHGADTIQQLLTRVSSMRSASTSWRFSSGPESDSSTASPAHRPFWAIRPSSQASG